MILIFVSGSKKSCQHAVQLYCQSHIMLSACSSWSCIVLSTLPFLCDPIIIQYGINGICPTPILNNRQYHGSHKLRVQLWPKKPDPQVQSSATFPFQVHHAWSA
eukprot:scpid61654/ scgid12525/ 